MFSLLATSWDSKERLIKSFPRAAENIRIIEEVKEALHFINSPLSFRSTDLTMLFVNSE